eukprot:GILI01018797.1.p1 GENE.GILI01018797.1~~GILI01018797.1.p1  ORF type:complete len:386 (-),score=31.26 GILI01018797.1:373-1530(-)
MSSLQQRKPASKLAKRKEERTLTRRRQDASTSVAEEEDKINKAASLRKQSSDHSDWSSCGLSSAGPSPSSVSPPANDTLGEQESTSNFLQSVASKEVPLSAQRHCTHTGRPLYSFDEVPVHLQDNRFIRNYYRAHMTTADCFVSVFEIHNETGNIWTHLLGLIVYCYILIWVHTSVLKDDTDLLHRLMLTILIGSLMACLAASTLFHVVLGHEELWVYKISHALDYGGATCLLMGTFLPICYYVFVCQPHLQAAYILMACVLGITGIVAPLVPWFEEDGMFWARLGIYGSIGASAAAPTFHMFLSTPLNHITLPIYVGIVFIFINTLLATSIYASNFPERFAPGRFDLWFSSHQIWHSLIFLGGVVQIFNGIALYQNWSIMHGQC